MHFQMGDESALDADEYVENMADDMVLKLIDALHVLIEQNQAG